MAEASPVLGVRDHGLARGLALADDPALRDPLEHRDRDLVTCRLIQSILGVDLERERFAVEIRVASRRHADLERARTASPNIGRNGDIVARQTSLEPERLFLGKSRGHELDMELARAVGQAVQGPAVGKAATWIGQVRHAGAPY